MVAQAGVARSGQNVAEVAAEEPFGVVLRNELIERGITTGMGNPNWSGFAQQLPGVHYETLRKAVTGERSPRPELMEACAAALEQDPAELFWEYALYQAQTMFDPAQVGIEQALENLHRWQKKQR